MRILGLLHQVPAAGRSATPTTRTTAPERTSSPCSSIWRGQRDKSYPCVRLRRSCCHLSGMPIMRGFGTVWHHPQNAPLGRTQTDPRMRLPQSGASFRLCLFKQLWQVSSRLLLGGGHRRDRGQLRESTRRSGPSAATTKKAAKAAQ